MDRAYDKAVDVALFSRQIYYFIETNRTHKPRESVQFRRSEWIEWIGWNCVNLKPVATAPNGIMDTVDFCAQDQRLV